MVYPVPAVMVSCGATPEEYNIMTAAWVGTICSEPAMCYVSIRPERHSYEIIKRTGELAINLTTENLAKATDWCGVRSGRDFDKFALCGLTPEKCSIISAPAIAESPVSIECRVKTVLPLGTHDMFICEVVNVLVDDAYLDPASGKFDIKRAGLIAYAHGEYFSLGESLGSFGWSVKGSTRKREIRLASKK